MSRATATGGTASSASPGSGPAAAAAAAASNGIPDALLERLMDRKLRMLDMEYEECLKATKGYDLKDYDSGPTGDDEEEAAAGKSDAAATAKQFGYAPFGGDSAAGSSLPIERESGQADEWSEAWAEYKKDCAEEAAEAARLGITDADVAKQNETVEAPPPPKPLTQATVATIRGVMAGVKLAPPPWARNVPEHVWMAQILQRAGLGALNRPAAGAVATASAATAAAPNNLEATVAAAAGEAAAPASSVEAAVAAQREKERKQRKKAKKKAKEKQAKADAAKQPTDDFEANFPPVEGATIAAAGATANNAQESELHSPD